MNLLVPVSYFCGAPRSEIWRIDCDKGISERWLTLPNSGREVRGKGITGLQRLNALTWVGCDFNRVFTLDSHGKLRNIREATDANDLHQLSVSDGLVYLANAGRDAVDILNSDLELVARHDGLNAQEWYDRLHGKYQIDSNYYDPPDSALPFFQRRVPDKWHFNHVVKLPRQFGGNIAATCFAQKALYDAVALQPISNALPHSPHDGAIHANKLWLTTVDGGLYAACPAMPLYFNKVLDLFSIIPYHGWCRGLLFTQSKLFVGITAVNHDNARADWLRVPPSHTRSGVCQLNASTYEFENFYDFTCAAGARIFSMVEETNDEA